jgi:hypothetical protein
MEQEAADIVPIRQPRGLPRFMGLMASIVVAFEGLYLMTQILQANFVSLGVLSKETVSLILLQIVIFSCIIGIFSWISLTDTDRRFGGFLKHAAIVSFGLGLILSVEGLVAINLSGFIIAGTTSTIMISVGLMLFTLGVLSMVSYVLNERKSSLHGSVHFVGAILFILLMLPPAFLATLAS